jgi:iron complex outermembrane receptor protein
MSVTLRHRTMPAAVAVALFIASATHSVNLAFAQETTSANDGVVLPDVQVIQSDQAPTAKAKKKNRSAAKSRPQTSVVAEPVTTPDESQGLTGNPAQRAGSLTVPSTAEATAEINQTPGGVEVVPGKSYKDSTPANTIKDALGWVPGVIIQPKWGPDARISIRGSGLTRNYGNRGINMLMDGIPINSSDGLFDLFEIDPSAYRYIEVYKGANALRYGSNSLGGAINFVTPTGYNASAFDSRVDVGSFGYVRSQLSTGAVSGPWDYFINLSAQREDGYRDHSNGDIERLNANLGYRISPDAETRFYLNANRWRARIPGELTKDDALNSPRMASPAFVLQDQQRNIDSLRVANKTALRLDGTLVEFGIYTHQRHVDHPIYQYLDYDVHDYGGFVRAVDDRMIGGYRNRLIIGANILDGELNYRQYVNNPGAVKGALTFSTLDKSDNASAYAENSFYVVPTVSLIAGVQFQHSVRDREDRFLSDGDQSGSRTYDIWSPKVGVLWDVDPTWQVFGNISRSAEVPTFDVNTFSSPASSNVDAQTAITYEIGTRGNRRDFTWDISLYRAEISNELQCLTLFPWAPCTVTNADHTVHQGIEAGLGLALARSVFDVDDQFWFNGVYTYNDFFFVDDPMWGNNSLPGVPPHYLRAEVLYKQPNGFFAGPNVEWMPQEFFADNANSLTVDPYALLNFKIGYDPGSGWSGYLEGRNLLDKRYIASTVTAGTADLNSELFNPGIGRAVYGGVRFKW